MLCKAPSFQAPPPPSRNKAEAFKECCGPGLGALRAKRSLRMVWVLERGCALGPGSLRELEMSKEVVGGPHKGRGEVGLRVETGRRKPGPEAFP